LIQTQNLKILNITMTLTKLLGKMIKNKFAEKNRLNKQTLFTTTFRFAYKIKKGIVNNHLQFEMVDGFHNSFKYISISQNFRSF